MMKKQSAKLFKEFVFVQFVLINLTILLVNINESEQIKRSMQNNLEVKKRMLNIYESLNRLPINDNQIKQLNSFSERMLKQVKVQSEQSTQQLLDCQESVAQYTRMLVTGGSNKRSIRNNAALYDSPAKQIQDVDLTRFASLNAKSSSKFLHRELDFYLFVSF